MSGVKGKSGIYKRSKNNLKNLSKAHLNIKHTEETKNKMSQSKSFENHPNWKGDNVKYRALHHWVSNKLGRPNFCEDCKNIKLNHRQYHWANISGNYKRIITDWRRLCVKCHKKFDKKSLVENYVER